MGRRPAKNVHFRRLTYSLSTMKNNRNRNHSTEKYLNKLGNIQDCMNHATITPRRRRRLPRNHHGIDSSHAVESRWTFLATANVNGRRWRDTAGRGCVQVGWANAHTISACRRIAPATNNIAHCHHRSQESTSLPQSRWLAAKARR